MYTHQHERVRERAAAYEQTPELYPMAESLTLTQC